MTNTASGVKPAAVAPSASKRLAGWTLVSEGGKRRMLGSIAARSSKRVYSSVSTVMSSLWLESCMAGQAGS